MSRHTMLSLIEEGLANGRISPQLAAYIAAELLSVDARSTGYDDTLRLDEI